MKEKTEQNSGSNKARFFFGSLAAEKKKGITAVCLLTVMTLMWARVFIGKSPRIAPADQAEQTLIAEQSVPEANSVQPGLSVRFIELPKIEGRNDRIARDFFANKDSVYLAATDTAAGQAIKGKIIKKIESTLKLEAIVIGNSPQAFINNRLFKPGDKIDISDGNVKYECVIEKISEMEVLIDCLGTKIKLKIANIFEVIEQQ